MHGGCQSRAREAGSNKSRHTYVDKDLFSCSPFNALFEEDLEIIIITITNNDASRH